MKQRRKKLKKIIGEKKFLKNVLFVIRGKSLIKSCKKRNWEFSSKFKGPQG